MSAENQLDVVAMENGEFWLVERAVGDTDWHGYGRVNCVVSKYVSYEAAFAAGVLADSAAFGQPGYYYTEYGFQREALESLLSRPKAYIKSSLAVWVTERKCCHVDHREAALSVWQVTETSQDATAPERVIISGVTYAEALTVANRYKFTSPDVIEISFPTQFVHFRDLDHHDCEVDDPYENPEAWIEALSRVVGSGRWY